MATGNNPPKISPHYLAASICFGCALLVLAIWGFSGAPMVTQYEVAQEQTTVDEFGDEITTTEMVEQFQFGLLPDKGYDGALPLSGGLLLVGGALVFIGKRRRTPSA